MTHLTDLCPGPCNHHYRRAHHAYTAALDAWLAADPDQRGDHPEPPTIEPTVGDPVWCRRCLATVRRALADLDDLAALLEADADGHRRRPSDDRVTGTTSSSSPSIAVDTLDELYHELTGIEDLWRNHRSYPTRPQRGHGAHARTSTLAWLAAQLDDILTDPGMAPFGTGILGWQRRLQTLTHTTPEARRRAGRCPRCDMVRTLRRREDGYTECDNCGRLLNEDEYQQLVTDQAERPAS